MVLKEHELLQIDEAYLRGLQEENPDALVSLSVQLTEDLKEAWERMNQNSSNSSRPPSSHSPWDSVGDVPEDSGDENEASPPPDHDLQREADTSSEGIGAEEGGQDETAGDPLSTSIPSAEEEAKPALKAGRQPGSQGFGRTQRLAVTEEVHHTCSCCSGCGERLPEAGQQAWTGFYCVDVVLFEGQDATPGLQLTNTLHRYYQCSCPHCGLENRSEPYRHPPDKLEWDQVELSEWRLIGPSLASLIGYLCMDMCLSRRKAVTLLYDLLGLQLSTGAVQQCIVEAGRALSPVEEEIVQEILDTELLHGDETSHKEAGALLWLWVFVTTTTALFLVGSRGKEIWRNLLDSCETVFEGWLMTDGYQVYREYSRRLRCWAHLLRKAVGLSECYTPSSRALGKQLKQQLDKLMGAVYKAREGPDKGTVSIAGEHQETVQEIRRLCERMADSSHEKTRKLGREFLNDWEAIFRILEYPAWPLTNNEAERALRHWVILRRMSQGTRSETGSRALALFASVMTTCRLRKASPLLFIRDVIQARRVGLEVPALPAIPAE